MSSEQFVSIRLSGSNYLLSLRKALELSILESYGSFLVNRRDMVSITRGLLSLRSRYSVPKTFHDGCREQERNLPLNGKTF